MQNVVRAVSEGAAFRDAVLGALMTAGFSLAALASKHDLYREQVSEVVNLRRVPTREILVAFAKELGGTPVEWWEFWWSEAREASELTLGGR